MQGTQSDKCSAGPLQCQSAATKQGQLDYRAMSPDISMLSPELQEQWHVAANEHLGPIKIRAQSGIKAVWQCIKAVWQCNKCPAEQPHVWTAVVASRTRGTQCPYCSNRLVCLHNSLASVAPDAAQYWNHSKNNKHQSRC